MKKLSSIALFMVAATFTAYAQDKGAAPSQSIAQEKQENFGQEIMRQAKQETEILSKLVSLDEEQRAKILDMNIALGRRMRLSADASGDKAEQLRHQIEQNRVKFYSQVLSEDQMSKYNEYRNKMKEKEDRAKASKQQAPDSKK